MTGLEFLSRRRLIKAGAGSLIAAAVGPSFAARTRFLATTVVDDTTFYVGARGATDLGQTVIWTLPEILINANNDQGKHDGRQGHLKALDDGAPGPQLVMYVDAQNLVQLRLKARLVSDISMVLTGQVLFNPPAAGVSADIHPITGSFVLDNRAAGSHCNSVMTYNSMVVPITSTNDLAFPLRPFFDVVQQAMIKWLPGPAGAC
jgi:hypothetical protein